MDFCGAIFSAVFKGYRSRVGLLGLKRLTCQDSWRKSGLIVSLSVAPIVYCVMTNSNSKASEPQKCDWKMYIKVITRVLYELLFMFLASSSPLVIDPYEAGDVKSGSKPARFASPPPKRQLCMQMRLTRKVVRGSRD